MIWLLSHIDYNNYNCTFQTVSYRHPHELLHCTIVNVKHVINKVVCLVTFISDCRWNWDCATVFAWLWYQESACGADLTDRSSAAYKQWGAIWGLYLPNCFWLSNGQLLVEAFNIKSNIIQCFNTVMEFSFWIMILDVSTY